MSCFPCCPSPSGASKCGEGYPKLAIVLHESKHELVEAVPDKVPLEVRVLHFLHLEYVCGLWVLEVLLDFFLVENLELVQSFLQRAFHLLRKRWQVLVVEQGSRIQLHNDTLSRQGNTSDSTDLLSSIWGDIPTIKGTGAVMYSLRVEGRMGMRTCSQRKGKIKARKASTAYPRTVLD